MASYSKEIEDQLEESYDKEAAAVQETAAVKLENIALRKKVFFLTTKLQKENQLQGKTDSDTYSSTTSSAQASDEFGDISGIEKKGSNDTPSPPAKSTEGDSELLSTMILSGLDTVFAWTKDESDLCNLRESIDNANTSYLNASVESYGTVDAQAHMNQAMYFAVKTTDLVLGKIAKKMGKKFGEATGLDWELIADIYGDLLENHKNLVAS